MADQPAERPTPEAERLNAAIDRLLAERRPTDAPTSAEEAELLQVAALLKQARPGVAEPRLAYADVLGRQLRAARRPPPSRVSRRRALAAGAAGAAAVAAGAAGFALGRLADPPAPPPAEGAAQGAPAGDRSRELTVIQGQWFPVARLADVPPGTVVAFTAGAVLGHLVNQGGTLLALSAICTHMGCLLRWQAPARQFFCPCHGATFSADGVIQPTPEYPYRPPPLPRLEVRVDAEQVWVWSAAADAAPLGARERAEPQQVSAREEGDAW